MYYLAACIAWCCLVCQNGGKGAVLGKQSISYHGMTLCEAVSLAPNHVMNHYNPVKKCIDI